MKKQFARSLVATLLAGLIAGGQALPVFAQDQQQAPAPALPAAAPVQTANPTPLAPAIPVSLGLSKYNFRHAPRPFPNLIDPYKPIHIDEPNLTNSPRIDQLVHDGKLELTLQDAVELALENSLDIVVQRYVPWLTDLDILKAESGGFGRGNQNTAISASTANTPILNFDPVLTATLNADSRQTPVNNPLTSGTGTGTATATTPPSLGSHTSQYNFQYTQGLQTGTSIFASWNNTRSSTSSTFNLFNPAVQTSIFIGFQQQLLNGFGPSVNTRNIRIAKNNRKIADWAFTQQAITTVTNTVTDYWELVYARENVKVQQQAVDVAAKLYSDNKKQLEIGTMAPLDVTRAESELATDRQNLIVAQTVQLQNEQILKNAISKNPLAPNLINVEIIPTELPVRPELVEAPSFEDAVKEAFAKRPELQEQVLNLLNGEIDVKATRNALLPVATLSAEYGTVGLSGNSLTTNSTTIAGSAVVDANGNAVNGIDPITGLPVPIFIPATQTTVTGVNNSGLGSALSQAFHSQFPDFNAQLTFTLPIRNRSAQADNQRAILTQRQLEAQLQQLKNAALLDVRNSYIALVQDRAQVDAAAKARELQQQTFDAEQKKYQLGASTVYLVIQTQRDLIAAQGTELRALANLVEAKANYERSVGRTLEVNRVTVADAKSGAVERETLIPGTLGGHVVGTENLFTPNGEK